MSPLLRCASTCFALVLLANGLAAQELAPRSYWPTPKGTKVAVVGYAYSSGDIVTDPSLPIVGVDSRIGNAVLGYRHTLSLGGRTANLLFEVPHSSGTTVGEVEGVSRRRDVSGLADVRVQLSVNLLGAPSLDAQGFQELRAYPRPLLGASLKIQAPTGQYERNRLINVGTNRWSFKPELGLIVPIRPRWLFEAMLGTWFFTDNDEFLGVTREQDPVVATELHLIKRQKPGFWFSFDLNYYVGGRSTIGGALRADQQRNSRAGITVVVPFQRRYAIKASYSTGVVTESGGDFESVLASFQMVWR